MTGQHFRRVVVANKSHDHGRLQECHSIECLYLLVLVGDIWWDWWWGNISYFVLHEHRAIHLPHASSPIRDHRHKESCCICVGILLGLHRFICIGALLNSRFGSSRSRTHTIAFGFQLFYPSKNHFAGTSSQTSH